MDDSSLWDWYYLLEFFVGVLYIFKAEADYENSPHKAVAKESAKYSMRSPISCSWQLEVTGTGKSTRHTVSNIAS